MEWYISVLKQYAIFEGRAKRKEYWMFTLINIIISYLLIFIDNLFGTMSSSGIGLISFLYALGVFLPGLGVTIRRLHDVGKSGWFWFIALIPIVGWIWLIVLLATDSNAGSNKYGTNRKETEFTSSNNQIKNEISATNTYINTSAIHHMDELKKLAEFKDAGIITEEEFNLKKQDLLNNATHLPPN